MIQPARVTPFGTIPALTLPLEGITVQICEYDQNNLDYKLAEVTTDAAGNFYKWLDICRPGSKDLEIIIKIKAKNKQYDIVGKSIETIDADEYVTSWRSWPRSCDGNSYTEMNFGTLQVNRTTFRALGFALNAWKFADNYSGITLKKRLIIRNYPLDNSFFIPDYVCNVPMPTYFLIPLLGTVLGTVRALSAPTIFISSDNAYEDVTYHEFGHFVMWNLQDFCWTDLATGSFAHHSYGVEANSRIAWTEGFANGFGRIVDAYYHNFDGESYFDEGIAPFNHEVIEDNRISSSLVNGYLSEYFIGCAIYDLWDGFKNLDGHWAGLLPRHYDDVHKTLTSGWFYGNDDVEFDFKDICQAVRDGDIGGLNEHGQISNIQSFYNVFCKNLDCNQKNAVRKVFDNNRVVKFNNYVDDPLTAFNERCIYGGMNNDDIFIDIPASFFTQRVNIDHVPVPFIPSSPANYNYNIIAKPTANIGTLSENFFINSTGVLQLNNNQIDGSHDASHHLYPPKFSRLNLTTCGNIKIDNAGTLIVGDMGDYYSDLTINNGALLDVSGNLTVNKLSTLVIESGATLVIRAGTTTTVEGKIQIKPGAYYCIDKDAMINILPGGEFSTDPSAIKGYNHVWLRNFTDNHNVPICTIGVDCEKSEFLLFDGIDDLVQIQENGSLNLGTGDFTIEAFIKSNVTSLNHTHQAIISKRTFASGSDADGFLFGIWGETGQLFMQLKGTPNIRNYSSPSVLDGKCHHVAVRRVSGVLSFFIDGNDVGFGDLTSNRNISSTGTLRIGFNHVSHLPFDGFIGGIRVWNYARTHSQILMNLYNKLSPPIDGLMGYWDMTEKNNSTILSDLSSHNNVGMLGTYPGYPSSASPKWISACDPVCDADHDFKSLKMQTTVTEAASSAESLMKEGYNITVYPNPFKNEVNISLTGVFEKYPTISIFNMSGGLILKTEVQSDNYTINGENLSSGMYIIQVIGENVNKSFRVVKE